MTKYVPGPWGTVASLDGSGDVGITAPSGSLIGEAFRKVKDRRILTGPEVEANARLMAAAPDLLAALKGVVAVADRATVEFDAARAAIKLATEGR